MTDSNTDNMQPPAPEQPVHVPGGTPRMPGVAAAMLRHQVAEAMKNQANDSLAAAEAARVRAETAAEEAEKILAALRAVKDNLVVPGEPTSETPPQENNGESNP